MRILLINPKDLKGGHYVIIPNLGLGYIAAALLKEKHKVEILDCVKENYGCDDVSRYCENKKIDIVGFTLFTLLINSVKEYAKSIKKINKDIIIVLGGPHSIVEPVETLEIITSADFSFWGEAEIGFPQLVNKIDKSDSIYKCDLSDIQNLVWRKNGDVICNPKQMIEDLDKVDYPAWELIQPNDYPFAPSGVFTSNRKIAPIIITRGCPYACTFCSASKISGRRIRKRNINNIIEEIKILKEKFGIEEIQIMDDNFTQDREFAMTFCEKLIKERVNIDWACHNGVRLDTLDEKLLGVMQDSGCYSLSVGIESGEQRILDHMKKMISICVIKEKIKLIKEKTNIEIAGLFIIGYPEETINDIKKTIKFAIDLKIDRANFHNFTPLPGSEIYERLKKNGELKDVTYDDLHIHDIIYAPRSMSKRMLEKLQRRAHLMFYLNPRVAFGLIKYIKSLLQLKLIFQRCSKVVFFK